MSHFSENLLAADPEALPRLRTILHGEAEPAAPPPDAAERFGVRAAPGKSSRRTARGRKGSAQGSEGPKGRLSKTLVTP
ncbi:hypothetical protein [Methylobacterium nigriterrae]|uniref:hypothetical protein n=1 Tax=Methylobacterium nigriterrae TaxID=3127512 RepID=UPI0030136E40